MSRMEKQNPLLQARRNALLFTSRGADGQNGKDGKDGKNGVDGKSAYEYAVAGGYAGSEAEFAAKLAQDIPATLAELEEDSAHRTVTEAAKGMLEKSSFIALVGEDEDGNTYEYELLGYTDVPM